MLEIAVTFGTPYRLDLCTMLDTNLREHVHVDRHLRRGGVRGSCIGAAPRRLPGWVSPPSVWLPAREAQGWRCGYQTRALRASGASKLPAPRRRRGGRGSSLLAHPDRT